MVMIDKGTLRATRTLLTHLEARKLKIATAESCTGGLVTAVLTEIPGSSAMVDRGFVTYSNASKRQMLGVSARTLTKFGAVSRETALAMAKGALKHSDADITVAITGIAGPTGGSRQKPVGLVHIAVASRDGQKIQREFRFGAIGRSRVRKKSMLEAFEMLRSLANQNS
jgi:nicotinamide-nucleotide amidase